MSDHYDIVILGSGAGGGTLLARLARTGKRILVLERGGFLPRERANWDERRVQLEGAYDPPETWNDRDGNPFTPGVKYFVGGNTKVWGAATLRMRPSDFGEVRHHGGLSPAWPIDYAELEPFYTEAEQLWRVRGARGVDPTEGPASAPYPFAPLRHEPRVERLVADFARTGVRAWPIPLAIQHDEGLDSACIRCSTCDGFPCLVRGKSDAETICVRPALAHPNVTLVTGARATRLETDATGRRIVAVHVERDGTPETYHGDVVVTACGAVNSAALLLRSACDRHPHGLANGSGQVGRNYMCHQNSAVFALSRTANDSVFQKTFAISDWYHASDDREFPLGLVQPLNRTPALLLGANPPAVAGGHTPEHLASHSLEFWLTSEDLPDPANRVRLGAGGGIVLEYAPNNTEAHARLTRRLATALARVEGDGFDPEKHFTATRMPVSVCSHQCGTLRMGDDPRTSVLDRNARAHEIENLYVADASPFPSSGAVNPTLTILALALRLGAHLESQLG